MAYPGGSDLGIEDKVGAQFSLVWGRNAAGDVTAEIAVSDGYGGTWSAIDLDREQLRVLAATILVGLSADAVRAALEAA